MEFIRFTCDTEVPTAFFPYSHTHSLARTHAHSLTRARATSGYFYERFNFNNFRLQMSVSAFTCLTVDVFVVVDVVAVYKYFNGGTRCDVFIDHDM